MGHVQSKRKPKGPRHKSELKEGEKLPDLLKVAAIYGPNASGKSSFIRAMGIIGQLLTALPSSNDEPLPVSPFRFDPRLQNEPSFFEYNFIQHGLRYRFVLRMTAQRIIEEQLVAYPKGKETLLYQRRFVGEGEQYVFGASLEGGKEVHNAWRRLTSPKMLFISQAVANSSEELTQLRRPFGWFQTGLLVIEQNNMMGLSAASIRFLKMASDYTSDLRDFLKEVDIPVSAIQPLRRHTPKRHCRNGNRPPERLRQSVLCIGSRYAFVF